MLPTAGRSAVASQSPPPGVFTNPHRAQRIWPPDFTKLSEKHQFRLERRYRRRAKLKWARPRWTKAVKLAQWGSGIFVLTYGVLFMDWGKEKTPFQDSRLAPSKGGLYLDVESAWTTELRTQLDDNPIYCSFLTSSQPALSCNCNPTLLSYYAADHSAISPSCSEGQTYGTRDTVTTFSCIRCNPIRIGSGSAYSINSASSGLCSDRDTLPPGLYWVQEHEECDINRCENGQCLSTVFIATFSAMQRNDSNTEGESRHFVAGMTLRYDSCPIENLRSTRLRGSRTQKSKHN